MNIILIHKVELSDTNLGLKFSEVGYTLNNDIRDEINTNYNSSIGYFIENNLEGLYNETVSIESFFLENDVDYVYVSHTEIYDSEEATGINITNINQL